MQNFSQQRSSLLAWLQSQGIRDQRVLFALEQVPRELFVEQDLLSLAYADRALPISQGQTISQPLMVATMTQALNLSGRERVLEIGTGSGYQTALLAQLAGKVYSIERYPELARQAKERLSHLPCKSPVTLLVGDGTLGWPEAAPYDRILVTAAAPAIPSALLDQLAPGGLLVIPVGSEQARQDLQVVQRTAEGFSTRSLGYCVFVPLIGAQGWKESCEP
ncbi:protein-L-isoaspartate(D-aspartate) O-methyltransferase [Tengunoibacter tsumagoiensis]|uniref:Protein-L-isoaspartate O-methyltransferase n=1 Tax=Tengunoibacter tsumagoiensis TaxID=2014871 RepID=A0A402A2E5_9CHLR|nr:protein-L-isoaspartate(D-aspartate) O-methyltransferase [Tengunoibacter tsumagoiensis]GCE13226.1 protein-L-isoaspartate O-methyltransferase [Tengunoibacter tsumagoiensis]